MWKHILFHFIHSFVLSLTHTHTHMSVDPLPLCVSTHTYRQCSSITCILTYVNSTINACKKLKNEYIAWVMPLGMWNTLAPKYLTYHALHSVYIICISCCAEGYSDVLSLLILHTTWHPNVIHRQLFSYTDITTGVI